jgi:hypothetical protein
VRRIRIAWIATSGPIVSEDDDLEKIPGPVTAEVEHLAVFPSAARGVFDLFLADSVFAHFAEELHLLRIVSGNSCTGTVPRFGSRQQSAAMAVCVRWCFPCSGW